jgi:hypothetical protein
MQLKIIQLHLIHEFNILFACFIIKVAHTVSQDRDIYVMVASVGVPVEISQWIGQAIGMLIWHLVPAQGNALNDSCIMFARMVLQGERDVSFATESEDFSDIRKDMVLDLCVVVGLFVHVWCVVV